MSRSSHSTKQATEAQKHGFVAVPYKKRSIIYSWAPGIHMEKGKKGCV